MRNRAWLTLSMVAAFGCNDDLAEQELTAGSGEFAVGSDNFTGASSISLLDDKGEVSDDDWLSSKVKNPKLRSPLSEDVVFPTVSASARYLTTIERGLGVITRFDLEEGTVLGQLRTDDRPEDDDEDSAAFRSNPYDVWFASEESAWVVRWEPNPNADAEERERGNDVIEWNPKTWQRTDRRIALSELDETIEETVFDADGNTSKAEGVAYASPSAIIPVGGDFAAVGITGITKSYNYAEGKLAIVNLKSGRLVSHLQLEGLSNCGEVKPVPAEPKSVIVACVGAYGDGGASAGILKIEVDDAGKAEIKHAFRVADHEDAANTNSNVASLGGDIVVAVAQGSIDPETMAVAEPDKLFRLDLASGKQTELWESTGAFALGTPAYAVKTGLLLVPDAGTKPDPRTGVERFTVDDKRAVKHDAFVEVAADTGLAARRVLAL
jgi:hypothetical protein